jgi:predicted MFS family arabinose efflux permease
MSDRKFEPSASAAALVGLLALAGAMGIGRFALTPILPLMQQDQGLSLAAGSWLATTNYLGYLAGALACIAMNPPPTMSIRWGLVSVGGLTLAMGLCQFEPAWLALRSLAGVASAFVLVGTSAWAIPILSQHGREEWSGHVFAGVGIGIAFAGLVGLVAGIGAWGSRVSWIALGVVALLLSALLWPRLPLDKAPSRRRAARERAALPRPALIAALCYASFGFGYIIPATYLPALARSYIDDPRLFGLIWPVFGVAAAISTIVSASLFRDVSPRRLWMWSKWVLAAGVLAPVLRPSLPMLVFSAVCVGGTFVVITMAGLKEALRLGGTPASLAVGVMTAAFGTGQIAGPLLVGLLGQSDHAFVWASAIAAASLAAGNVGLLLSDRKSIGKAYRA